MGSVRKTLNELLEAKAQNVYVCGLNLSALQLGQIA